MVQEELAVEEDVGGAEDAVKRQVDVLTLQRRVEGKVLHVPRHVFGQRAVVGVKAGRKGALDGVVVRRAHHAPGGRVVGDGAGVRGLAGGLGGRPAAHAAHPVRIVKEGRAAVSHPAARAAGVGPHAARGAAAGGKAGGGAGRGHLGEAEALRAVERGIGAGVAGRGTARVAEVKTPVIVERDARARQRGGGRREEGEGCSAHFEKENGKHKQQNRAGLLALAGRIRSAAAARAKNDTVFEAAVPHRLRCGSLRIASHDVRALASRGGGARRQQLQVHRLVGALGAAVCVYLFRPALSALGGGACGARRCPARPARSFANLFAPFFPSISLPPAPRT